MISLNLNLPITVAEGAIAPTRAHPTDAGLDLYAHGRHTIPRGKAKLVNTGIAAAIPEGHVGLLFPRSSLHKNHYGAQLANAVGVIDSSYRGEIMANIKAPDSNVYINDGDKIVQFLIVPIITPQPLIMDTLPTTERGTGGFGSSGK